MDVSWVKLAWLAATWLGYFVLHSVSASLGVKRWFAGRWPKLMPGYRLGFNLLAGVSLLPPLAMIYLWQESWLWQWQGVWAWIGNGLAGLALLGFVWSLRFYDGDEFLGFRQLRQQESRVEDQERLQISPLHRYVRHPWYSFALVLIWTRDMDPMFLLSAVMMTLYFVLGSMLEERKLVVYHGAIYQEYCRRVPGLVPRPWRYLSKAAAGRLLANQQ